MAAAILQSLRRSKDEARPLLSAPTTTSESVKMRTRLDHERQLLDKCRRTANTPRPSSTLLRLWRSQRPAKAVAQ
eukprot:283850-Pyramimonas_sp.AAC.1